MSEKWRFHRLKLRMAAVLAVLLLSLRGLSLCWSLNSEGLALLKFREGVVNDPFGALSNWGDREGDANPCSWFGVKCIGRKVIILNLKDLCLEGILAPELGKLTYIKSIILRNNSFWGNIPAEIAKLKELEVLDIGYNNFSGSIPSDLGNNLSLSILLVDNNNFVDRMSPKLHKITALSEIQVAENQLRSAALETSSSSISKTWNTIPARNVAQRRMLQVFGAPNPPKARSNGEITAGLRASPVPSPSSSPSSSVSLPPSALLLSPTLAASFSPSRSPLSSISFSPSAPPSLAPQSSFAFPLDPLAPSPLLTPTSTPTPSPAPLELPKPPLPEVHHFVPSPSPTPTRSQGVQKSSKSKSHTILIWSGVAGGSLLILLSALGIFFCRKSKVVTVRPWATGLSGQLQKAFITGVPRLQRLELETACEDFSNIIGSLSDGIVYKGTLSSGVEIAVTSTAVKSPEDWSRKSEEQFRNKIDMLSKVNHKNFVNLIGYCEEEEPFTRMMVFEYAPNGTLFEHLHIKEAEHLDWGTRLRIAMGMAYCLEHMHQLTPPITLQNLNSSSVHLTEDYAAKISDFTFWNEVTARKIDSAMTELMETTTKDSESNVYSFGVILLEMLTGKFPYSLEYGSPMEDLKNGEKPLEEMVDPTLTSFQAGELEKLFEVIKGCVHPDPKQRPTMKEVTARLKEITSVGPDGATPKLSPLWWAELEILTTEAS
ncbi:Non-specific serine/threonine protein kinase [Bertholletia excelsa]